MKTLDDIKKEIIDTGYTDQRVIAEIGNWIIDKLYEKGLLMVWQPMETAPKEWYWEYGQQDRATRRKFNTGDILENAARCKKCGEYVRSNHQHDFVSCACGSVHVDGGSWYARRLGNPDDYEDIIVMYDDAKVGE